MNRDEYGGIVSDAPAQSSAQTRDEYGGIIGGGTPAPSGPSVDQKFQSDPAIQAAAKSYVNQKWDEYGKAAMQSQGQAIRDYAAKTFNLQADRSSLPALDYRPEHEQTIATAYVRSTIPADQAAKKEEEWKQEYLRNALPNAVAQQTDAAHPAQAEDVGRLAGLVNADARGVTKLVMDPVKGGVDLFYGLGSHSNGDGMHGAETNQTTNEQKAAASQQFLKGVQDHIDAAYPHSTAAVTNPGGIQDRAEQVTEMVPQLAASAPAFEAGGLQKALALGQFGASNFSASYDDLYRAAKSQGMNEQQANSAAMSGGLVDAAVNTYLMKYGALGRAAEGSGLLKRTLALTVKDALAQGAVGGTGTGVSEVVKFIETGEEPKIEAAFKSAIDSAGAGAVFGAVRGVQSGAGHAAPSDPTKATVETSTGKAVDVPIPDAAAVKAATVTPEAPPSEPSALPAIVDRATPKYRNSQGELTHSGPIEFANPADKAIYSVAVGREGKIATEARSWLDAQGYSEAKIAERGQELVDQVKAAAKPLKGEPLKMESADAVRPETVASEPTARPSDSPGGVEAPAVDAKAGVPGSLEGAAPVPTRDPGGDKAPAKVGTGEADKQFLPGGSRASDLPERHDVQRDQRDELLSRAMPKAYVVKNGISGDHAEVLNIHKELTGQDAIPYAGGRGRGFRKDGQTFYSVDGNNTPVLRREAIAHEATHWLQDNRPELVADVAKAIPADMRTKLAEEYKRQFQAQEGKRLDPKMEQSEVEAMAVGKAFTRMGVARQVMGQDAPAYIRAADAIMTKLRSLTGAGRLTNQVVETLQRARAEAYLHAPAIAGEHGPEAFLPGGAAAKAFHEDDVKPLVTDAVEAVSKAWDGVKRLIAPQTRSAQATETKGVLRDKVIGELAQRTDRLTEAFGKTKLAMDKLPIGDTRKFIDDLEHGRAQTNAALQPVADALRGVLDDRLKQVQALGTGKLAAFIQDYFPHLWKDPTKAATVYNDLAAKSPMEGRKSFLKKRSLPLFSDGIAKGLEPVTENPVEATMLRVREMDKYITAQQAFQEMRGKGLMAKVAARDVGKWKQKGYAQIADNIATIYAPPNRKGGLSIAGYWMAPEPVATVINNHLSPGLRSDPHFGKAFRGYLGAGNMMNQAQLGLSAFHATFTAFDSAVGRLALGIEHLGRGEIVPAAKAAASALTVVHPAVDNFRTGNAVMREWYKPGSTTPEIAAVVDAMKAAGGRVKMDDFYRTDMSGRMMEAFRKGNVLGGVLRSPFAAVETAAKPILEGLVPRMKLGAFMDMMKREMKPGMSREELRTAAGKAWDSVDNRLGEMVYDNLFWNKTVKDVAMASVRAVGWNLGTFRELGGGVLDTAKAAGSVATGKRPELTHRMAYTLALPLLTGIIGGATHYLLTGKRPDDMKDLFFPKTGEKDQEGHDVRLQMPGYMADVLKYGKDVKKAVTEQKPLAALTTIRHKTHPMLNTIMEMLANEDYYGVKIRNEDDPFVKQLADTAKHIGSAAVPFGVRDVVKLAGEGQGAKSVLPLLGVVKARADITHTDAELKASEMLKDSAPIGSRTQAQVDKAKMVRELSDSIHRHEPDAVDRLRAAVQSGKIGEGDVATIKRDQKTPGLLERMVQHLDAEQAMKVWEAADDAERRRIGGQIVSKLRSSKTLDRERRVELVKKFQTDWAALSDKAPAAVEE